MAVIRDVMPVFEVEIADAEWAALQDEFANWEIREQQGLPLKPYHPIVFRHGPDGFRSAEDYAAFCAYFES